ncbi:hypothetical protein GN956_G3097 [Arapaima gigas]
MNCIFSQVVLLIVVKVNFAGVFNDMVINKNCLDLKKGERYQVWTEDTVGRSLVSCYQDWHFQNHSVMGYISEEGKNFTYPMVSLTKQKAELESCINFSVILHCDQVANITFLVHPDERMENSSRNPSPLTGTIIRLLLQKPRPVGTIWSRQALNGHNETHYPNI